MKANKNIFWVFVFILFLYVNCGKKKMAWEDVKRINQYNIYTQFLKENPGTEYKKEIDQALESIKQQWHPEMRDVKSIAVEIEEDLSEGANFSKSRDQIKRALKEIVEGMGFEFIEFNKPGDAIIKVTLKGHAISGYYRSSKGFYGYHFSGAEVSGDITLTKRYQSLLSKKFYGKKSAGVGIGKAYNRKSDAPFNEAMSQSNFPAAGYALFTNLLNTKMQIIHHRDKAKVNTILPKGRLPNQKFIKEETQESISELKKKNVFTKSGDYLYAHEDGGTLLWVFKTKDYIQFNPYVTENNVYVCSGQYLYAIDPEDGSLNWKLDILEKNQCFTQNPIVLKNTVYIGYYHIYAVDAESGILKWKFRPDITLSILNLQLSTDGTDTTICVTSHFSRNYFHE